MAVKPTIQIGHPALKAKNQEITDFSDPKLKQLITDLTDSMHTAGLIGMAAPQIAANFQVFITEPRQTNARPKDQSDQLRVFINPRLVKLSKEQITIFEGCGSVLNGQLFGPVIRPKVVTVEAFDEHGQKFRFTADGILGRVIQHEFDHMIGVEFLEKVSDYKQMMSVDHYISQIKDQPQYKNASQITLKRFIKL